MSGPFKGREAEVSRWLARQKQTQPGTDQAFRPGHDVWPPPMRDSREDEPPFAEVEQNGAFSWSIRILHAWMQWGPDGMPFTHFGTRRSADARARRLLAAYTRKYERERQAGLNKSRIELTSPEEFRRSVEQRRETQRALAELRDPDSAWEREFAALDTRRRRRPRWLRRG